MINNTPEGQLGKYLIGDLGIARRHLARFQNGAFDKGVPIMVLREISQSIEDCVARIERDARDTE